MTDLFNFGRQELFNFKNAPAQAPQINVDYDTTVDVYDRELIKQREDGTTVTYNFDEFKEAYEIAQTEMHLERWKDGKQYITFFKDRPLEEQPYITLEDVTKKAWIAASTPKKRAASPVAPVAATITLATLDGHITYDWPLYLEHVKEEAQKAKGYDFIVLDGVAVDKGQSQYPTVEDFAKAHWQKLVAFYEAFEDMHKLGRK